MAGISRRGMLKVGGFGLAGLAWPARVEAERPARLSGLLHNEDSTNFFYFQEFPEGQAGAIVDRYVDVLADAGVSVLMCNTNARRTNYRSGVWEAGWDGFDPGGPDDQPFLAPIPPDERKTYRKLVGNMYEVHRQGVDYPARVIQRCRQRGISPWISLRMNDVHENGNLEHPFHSALWRRPELFRKGHPGYFARALDYAHAEVRDHYRRLVDETLERYDVDGLELDFMREPYVFSKGEEQVGRPILTEWVRQLRAGADAAANRCGHAVKLGVRVPSNPDTALGLGLDAPEWAHQGLVDLVVAAPRWETLEFAMPLKTWRERLGERVALAGGLEVNCRPYPGGPQRLVTREEACGAATAVLSGGADAVYLFNFFQHGHPGWPLDDYRRTLKAFASLAELRRQPRCHAVTFRDVTALDEAYRAPLPASGKRLSFALPLGLAPADGWRVEAVVGLAASADVQTAPRVSINGAEGARQRERTSSGGRLLTYAFPRSAVSGRGEDVVEVAADGDAPVSVLQVEVGIRS